MAALELSHGAPTMTAAPRPGWQGGWRDGVAYGLMGLPLAFVALPLYVQLPNHYATAFGIPLATRDANLPSSAASFFRIVSPLDRCNAWTRLGSFDRSH